MKTRNNFIKRSLWLCLMVLLAVVCILAGCSGQEEKTAAEPQQERNSLYWNVDKFVYADSERQRLPRKGEYVVRFAVDGKQVDLTVADLLTVNHIDTMEVMGLEFDENGVVVRAIPVNEIGYTILAEDDYVQSFTDDTILCNSLGNGNGLSKTLSMTDDTKIYMVDEDGSLLCGMPGTLKEKSKILAIADETGSLTHVYTVDPFVMGDVYWNHARKYNSTTKLSTRELDEQGRFAYQFSLNGEQMTLYTRDQEVANAIDGVAAKCMGLSFDENGYITEVRSTQKMTGGKSWGSWYYIMDIDDSILSAKKYSGNNVGSTARGVMAADCKVYDVSGKGDYIGEPTQLRLYDQVHGLRNEFGEICYLFVVSRTYEADIYYNVQRQYDSATKTTKRTPAADGYYYIKLAHNGQQVTLKTNNQDIVSSIDATAVRCFGLKVEGDEILDFYSASTVWGGRQFCSYDIVTAIQDGVIIAEEVDVATKGAQTYTGKMAKDCQVFDVSSAASVLGEKTTLQVGDKIHALKNLDGEVTYIFVVSRSIDVPVYWNVERKYDSDRKTTTRTPNAQGYYEITLAVDGQQKTFKTKDKALITEIDAVATKCFGLETKGNIITKMYKTANVKGGAQFCSWDNVTSIKGSTVVAKEPDGSETYTGILTSKTKVYDVTGLGAFVGEKTKLQVGDKIHALKDTKGQLTYVFVITRSYDVPIYWNVNRQYDSENKTTKRVPNEAGYYEIELAVNGQQKTYKTKSLELINELDAVATKCFGLVTKGDEIVRMYKTANVLGGAQFCSWDYVTSIKGNTVTAKEPDGSKTYTGTVTAKTQVYNVTGSGEFVGEKTTLQVGDKIHALQYASGSINIIYVVERTEKMVTQTAFCELCHKDVTWYSWDGVRAFENGKHYFLQHGIGLSNTAYIGSTEDASMEVTLDLRGYDIRASVRAFRIYGTLNLLDSVGDGVIYGNATGQATGFYVYDAGTFNMYGGNFQGGKNPNTQCGIGALGLDSGSKATFNMYGGSLQAGNTAKDGGNLTLYHSSVFNMYGGVICDGRTQTAGGNINADAKASINLYGGSITGGKASGTGNGVYGGQVSLYNNAPVVVDELYLNTALNVPDTLAEGSRIAVILASGSGAVTGLTPEENLTYIQGVDASVFYENGKLMIVGKPDKTAYCTHCQKDVAWYIWDGKFSLENGYHYYLDSNASVDTTAYIGTADNTAVSVCLDLNGKNIDASTRVFRVYGNLNLMDSVGTGVITGNTTGQASVFYVYENAVFNLYGGTLTSQKTVTSDNGAGIGGVDKGTMNMYGGKITGGVAKRSGGNLNLYNTGVLNLYGGIIENGTSLENSGGNIQMSGSSKLHIYGGSILGGSAGNLGNCINANGAVTLHGQDKITVTQIYLPGTKTLTVDGTLAEGSSIGILLEKETGAFTGTTVEANRGFFHSDTYDVNWAGGQLILGQAPAAHTGLCVHCNKEVTWTVWDGAAALENNGHYYLEDNVTVSATAYIGAADHTAVSVCLDLNGKNIDSTTRVFRVYGNLNLMDSVGTGLITGNTAGQASVFYVYENAVFNLYGGTLTSKKTVTSDNGAGIGGVDKGTMNMYGGKITGGVAKRSGGNLNLYNTGVLNLYGGIIENGTSQENSGGNIQMSAKSQLHIYGGSILGGSAGNLGDCINANGAVTIHGQDEITVTQIYLPGTKTLTVDGTLAEHSSIGILLEKETGVFTGTTVEANLGFFHSDTYDVMFTGGKLALQTEQPEDPNAHKHCLCGGLGVKGDHTQCTNVEWTAWPGVDALVLDGSVSYYLTEDVTVDAAIVLEEGQTLNLCLNGHAITTTANIYIFNIYGTLNLCDHADEDGNYAGAVTNLNNATGKGAHSRVFYLRGTASGASINLFGGNLSAPNAKATGTGGTVARAGSSTGSCTFRMYDGSIFGGNASSADIAGNIVLEKGSTTYLYGGLITGGSNDKGAGNVILKNGAQLHLEGGAITNGTGVNGSNVRVNSGCALAAVAGAITGGNVYATGTITVSDTATVEDIIYPE